ncbi:alpha/beta hydrolase [Tsukamurella sp. 8F]|uniref:alpha/beta fold hydrolase n=1 Tax=unclassified Tsukamurella TaxID=2633480 RepID=UPI0023B8C82D|nr:MULTISPECIES: alpha/beta hydrolase [unclassified Tsukamurella]MDF0529978.1 alpha/beta hydrolase [Tsukamurella sp. 8J]MDF0587250.1 alpha/beta hydrolase [Tsukamurella sp. 8F]
MYVVERGTGTPVVFLHGFPVDHRILLPLDGVFERAGGWRRLYLDLPGMGRTPVDDVASTDDIVDAVVVEIDARLGAAPFALVGNSFGGMVARAVAERLRDQVLGLATIAGAVVADHARRTLPDHTVLRRDDDAVAIAAENGAAQDYVEMAVVQSPDGARAFVEHVWPGLEAADEHAVERIRSRYALGSEPEDAEPLAIPTLFVTGRQDATVGYRDTWSTVEHYPRATFVVLDSAGHNVHLENPAVTEALIADWLSRVRTEAER